MRFIALALILLSLCSCAQENAASGPGVPVSTSGGDETRGGGDGCEMSYKHHLSLALDWIRSQQSAMAPEEWAKTHAALFASGGDALADGRVDCECVNEAVFVNGVSKTAGTKKIRKASQVPSFHTKVDYKRWFTQPTDVRTALACHEALVMAGVEKTGDERICRKMLKQRLTSSHIKELECTRSLNSWDLLTTRIDASKLSIGGGFEVTMELRSRRNFSGSWEDLRRTNPVFLVNETLDPLCWFAGENNSFLECAELDYKSVLMRHIFEAEQGNPRLNLDIQAAPILWSKLQAVFSREERFSRFLQSEGASLTSIQHDISGQVAECRTKYFLPGDDNNNE